MKKTNQKKKWYKKLEAHRFLKNIKAINLIHCIQKPNQINIPFFNFKTNKKKIH